uniref:Uncharacterized protein n=1 Tax=Knipowitschia caucasica TaxID=637954 RepID=A0AAV2K884_KNICA
MLANVTVGDPIIFPGFCPGVSELSHLSKLPKIGLSVGTGLTDGIIAAMLTICRPLLCDVGLAANTCRPSVAFSVSPCGWISCVCANPEFAMMLSDSKFSGWSVCVTGKHGTALF